MILFGQYQLTIFIIICTDGKKNDFKKVLDIECGIGRHSILFAKHGFEVTALDSSNDAINRLKNESDKQGCNITTVCSDLKELPFDNEKFDAVVAYHSIFHATSEGMVTAINEVYRVLKPNGEIYVTLISQMHSAFNNPRCEKIDENVYMKKEPDGNYLPHYYYSQNDVNRLWSRFKMSKLKQIEDIYNNQSDWHYYLHASRIG